MPTIVGSARDEVAGLMADTLMEYANLTADGFRQWLAINYGPEHVERMEALYPPSSAPVGAEGGDCAGATKGSMACSLWYYLVVTIASDDMVKCGARNVAQLLPSGVAYQYSWEYPNSPDGGAEPNDLTTNFVGHCSQNPYDFGNTVRASLVGGEAPGITKLMSTAWASLAKNGVPSAEWDVYNNISDASFKFGATVAESGMHPNKKAQCDFLRWCRGDNPGYAPVNRRGQPPQLCTPATPNPPPY